MNAITQKYFNKLRFAAITSDTFVELNDLNRQMRQDNILKHGKVAA